MNEEVAAKTIQTQWRGRKNLLAQAAKQVMHTHRLQRRARTGRQPAAMFQPGQKIAKKKSSLKGSDTKSFDVDPSVAVEEPTAEESISLKMFGLGSMFAAALGGSVDYIDSDGELRCCLDVYQPLT